MQEQKITEECSSSFQYLTGFNIECYAYKLAHTLYMYVHVLPNPTVASASAAVCLVINTMSFLMISLMLEEVGSHLVLSILNRVWFQ